MFTVLCWHAHCDWQNSEAFVYVIGKFNIMQTWKYIIVLNIKGKHNFIFVYCIHIVEIPTQKREYSWKCTELSLKWRRNWRIINRNNWHNYIYSNFWLYFLLLKKCWFRNVLLAIEYTQLNQFLGLLIFLVGWKNNEFECQ